MQALGLVVSAAIAAPFNLALAQTASQITPQTFEPQLQKQGRGIAIPEGGGQTAPKGAEALTVRIGDVAIEGGLESLADQEQRLRSELSGKTVSAADLFAAAGRLEKAYAAKGYGLVRVVLPAQRLTDGTTLRLVVVDGFLETIDTTRLPVNIQARVASLLAPLAGRKGLNNREIQRQLLLAGDLPGTVLRSTISRGTQVGGSILTIEARYKSITGSAGFDNSLPDTLGTYSFNTGLNFNSVLGLGETLYLRLSGAPTFTGDNSYISNNPRNRSLAAGLVLPLGTDGLSLNLEETLSRTTPEAASNGLISQSNFSRLSARLAYPLIRSRDVTLNLNAAFDAQNESVQVLNTRTDTSWDRLRVLRFGPDLSVYLPGDAVLSASLTASFGLAGLGARTLDEATSALPLSRQGADASFQKLDAEIGLRAPVADHLAFDLRAKGQTSFGEPLLNAEQFGLVSPSGLSSFALGSLQGDAGFVVRAEAQFPFTRTFALPFSLPDYPAQQGSGLPEAENSAGAVLVSPYLFAAYGGAQLYQPTALEQGWTRGVSYGAGLRLGAAERASFNAANLGLEYGRAIALDDSGDDQNRFTFALSFNF
jgi:hemolysin activation/secretion protein